MGKCSKLQPDLRKSVRRKNRRGKSRRQNIGKNEMLSFSILGSLLVSKTENEILVVQIKVDDLDIRIINAYGRLQDVQLTDVQLPDTQLPRRSATTDVQLPDVHLPRLPATKKMISPHLSIFATFFQY